MSNATPPSLRRLIEIDAALAGGGFSMSEFSEALGVSVRTVMRDLEVLRSLGMRIECSDWPDYVHRYADGRRVFEPRLSEDLAKE